MEITNNLSEKALYDYKVVKNAIAGDEKAYSELFKRYKDSVYFMILKMVNNRTDAEDLMFEAFEKAFSSLNYYSPQFAFSTWLFKIASNNTIDAAIYSTTTPLPGTAELSPCPEESPVHLQSLRTKIHQNSAALSNVCNALSAWTLFHA